ncbi:MAG: hypothetical protein KGL46_04880 [Hyphomicrobiales bacterium]|nr:hypothetical protein [Hyphomicrobiales bacterium]
MSAFRIARAAVASAAFLTIAGAAAPAYADCQSDFTSLIHRRDAASAPAQRLFKRGAGKINPVEACAAMGRIVGPSSAIVAYMKKNQQWCSISDDQVAAAEKGHQQIVSQRAAACSAAAKYRAAYAAALKQRAAAIAKMRAQAERQAAQGGGPQVQKMPAGPL